ncbi:hypothetical protein F0562_035424 [Nyssa sinensis]|uniref:PGG domain-containing protein n=1 Tax=Nyssa sinensis TaxID=561372 RepID=A0A5J5AE43_9ASTE|nr:hypothetical protein F0562_035424 [Nyssa sinensis]
MTALHIAASEGHVDVMKELLLRCPDCWEMTNSTGKNILHTAVQSEKKEAIEFILENYWHKSLINQKDVDGNTPLHLFAMSKNKSLSNLVKHPKVDKKAFNRKNLTPLDILEPLDIVRKRNIEKELRSAGAVLGLRNVFKAYNDAITARNKAREDEEGVIPRNTREVANTHLIVAALIATVTFTAGFTVPGGYEDNEGPNQGMAILTRKAAFQAFVIWNTIAMIFSTCAVYLHFITSTYVDEDKISNRLASAMILVILAMVAMVIAFVTGSYAVLANSSGLAIAVCVIGCFSFPVYYLLIKSRCNDDDL